jgi:hypothetical protein
LTTKKGAKEIVVSQGPKTAFLGCKNCIKQRISLVAFAKISVLDIGINIDIDNIGPKILADILSL